MKTEELVVERQVRIPGIGPVKTKKKTVDINKAEVQYQLDDNNELVLDEKGKPVVNLSGTFNEVLELFSGSQEDKLKELVMGVNIQIERSTRSKIVEDFGTRATAGSALAMVKGMINNFKTMGMNPREAAVQVLSVEKVQAALAEEDIQVSVPKLDEPSVAGGEVAGK